MPRRRDLKKEWGTAGFKYSWRKMEVAAQDRAGWRQVVCVRNGAWPMSHDSLDFWLLNADS